MENLTPAFAVNDSVAPGAVRERCPLCGGANDCRLCTTASYKGPCWCEKVVFPDELLARVPAEAKNKACICRACVEAFHREKVGPPSRLPLSHRPSRLVAATASGTTAATEAGVDACAPKPRPEDFYFDPGGMVVFTEAYHRRRGYCCGSGCRHCPFPAPK